MGNLQHEGGNSLNGSDKGGSQIAKGSARGSQQASENASKFGFKRQKSFNATSLKTKELQKKDFFSKNFEERFAAAILNEEYSKVNKE